MAESEKKIEKHHGKQSKRGRKANNGVVKIVWQRRREISKNHGISVAK